MDIANRPFVRRAGEAIQMLSTNVSSDDMFCSDILKQIACVSFFPPCNLETKKLTSICADSCPTYYEIISKCTSVFLQYDLDYNFNCLNPGTYYIGVPSRLFDVPENCRSYDTTGMNGINKFKVWMYPIPTKYCEKNYVQVAT